MTWNHKKIKQKTKKTKKEKENLHNDTNNSLNPTYQLNFNLLYFLNTNSSNYAKKKQSKPTLNTLINLFAIHIHDSHEVTLVHWHVNGRIHFYYADDMNSSNTAHIIKSR